METPLFETIRFQDEAFEVLDQTLLPSTIKYQRISTVSEAISAIKTMQVRGAPLIAVAALYSLYYEFLSHKFSTSEEILAFIHKSVESLKKSRPTAVNLSHDLNDLQEKAQAIEKINPLEYKDFLKLYVEANYRDYEKACEEISRHGADEILAKMDLQNKQMIQILTICNTGKLATPGEGTALGIIREIHRRNRLKKLYIPETRPYNQGSRLTASEAVFDHLPGVLITDSMAAVLMHDKKVDCVIVGADRVVMNGTTANKIGTYSLAVLAYHHKIPFYVACPLSTVDSEKLVGSQIIIEERPGDELKMVNGTLIAPKDIECWNPAFDLTYPNLIEKIITEKGDFKFDKSIGDWEQLTVEKLEFTLKHKMKLFDQDEKLEISDVADGNLNLVYRIQGKEKSLCVKQALPYVKCVGPQWELTLKRALFESECLKYESMICPENVPHFYYFNEKLALLAMQFLEAPHIILRKGLISQQKYIDIGKTIGVFIARTCYFSSGLYLKADEMRQKMSFWNENSLCALTEQVIFSDPYIDAPMNHWNTPYLDSEVHKIRADLDLITEAMKLRSRFIIFKQALIHGDLHSGSIMVDGHGSVKVIDSEFAFYGPIGFDNGAFISNLLLSFFSQAGHNKNPEYEAWILEEIIEFYKNFEKTWLELWNDQKNRKGDEIPEVLVGKNEDLLKKIQREYLRDVFRDSIGYSGAKMIRRVVGVAHVHDLDSIEDKEKRGECEKKALKMGVFLVKNWQNLKDIEEVVKVAKEINEGKE